MSPTTTAGIPIEVHLGPDEWRASLRHEARQGLLLAEKELPPTWLYDERGCELFEEITRLPEYYPTRAERSILTARADEIAELARPTVLVELGAGTAEKTRILLGAMRTVQRYVPFDVAESAVLATADAIAGERPDLDVAGVVGDFRHHIGSLPTDGRRLIAFLGGTIGNLRPEERSRLLRSVAATMGPGDTFLLGTDLVKDRRRLVAAYDDAAGVTAEFNRNVLRVLNRELGADFDLDRFTHVARFDEDHRWIEMRLRAESDMTVAIPGLSLQVSFSAGETMRTEISAKFEIDGVADELRDAGLRRVAWWTDAAGDFALTLAAPR